MHNCFPMRTQFAENVTLDASMEVPKRVLIVMDALKEFSMEILEWVLKSFTFDNSSRINILGITPYLNIPLSTKTWSDMWGMDLEDLIPLLEKNEVKIDVKYNKLQRLLDLCRKYGVVPEIRTETGHPLQLLVIEQITTLHATLVVFDRHHDKKHIEYYAKKIPCNMLVVNDNGKAQLIKKVQCDDSSSSPAPSISKSQLTPNNI
ncbi:uncharacterized protein LOC130994558 [Salvia miltiorrhiza]|uniref:uncharacterized protein LOC130994558 n=1 Tax=Salvia miltiorrhiza TaxID=226208 RepID=UPI0025ACA8F9|nr:uncharacterized protein LOC130994558 [Salvia miltiorrhiza]